MVMRGKSGAGHDVKKKEGEMRDADASRGRPKRGAPKGRTRRGPNKGARGGLKRGAKRGRGRGRAKGEVVPSGLRADAPSWVPSFGFKSYANIAKRKVEEDGSNGKIVEAGSLMTMLKKNPAVDTMLNLKGRKKSVDKEVKDNDKEDMSKLMRQVASNFALEVISIAFSRRLKGERKFRRDKARQRIDRLVARWQNHLREFESKQEPPNPPPKPKIKRAPKEEQSVHQTSSAPLPAPVPRGETNRDVLVEICKQRDANRLLVWANDVAARRKSPADLANRGDSVETHPLAVAIKKRSYAIINVLIDWGVHVDHKCFTTAKTSALHYACEIGDESIVGIFLNDSRTVTHLIELKDGRGRTPLQIACTLGHFKCARALLRAGANASLRDREQNTILHWACSDGELMNDDIVELILRKASYRHSVNARNEHGETPLHLAAKFGQDMSIARLIKAGADVDAVDNRHMTPLSVASVHGQISAAVLLLDRGSHFVVQSAEASAASTLTPSALHLAVAHGHKTLFVSLLEKAVQYKLIPSRSRLLGDLRDGAYPCNSLLHAACENGQWAMAEYLLKELKANVNGLNGRGKTALSLALSRLAQQDPPMPSLIERLLPKPSHFSISDLVSAGQTLSKSRGDQLAEIRALQVTKLLLRSGFPLGPEFKVLAKEYIGSISKLPDFTRSPAKQQEVDVQMQRKSLDCTCGLSKPSYRGFGSMTADIDLPGMENDSWDSIHTRLCASRGARLDPAFQSDLGYLFGNRDAGAQVELIFASGGSCRVHLAVACANSKMLRTMFSGSMRESQTLRSDVSMHQPKIVELFVRFLYTGNIAHTKFFKALHKAQEEELGDGRFVMEHVQNAVDLLTLANEMLCPNLEFRCARAVEGLLGWHVYFWRNGKFAFDSKKMPRLKSQHLHDIADFFSQLGFTDSERVCRDLDRDLNKRRVQEALVCVQKSEVERLCPNCRCPTMFLENHGLRFCMIDGVLMDFSYVCTKLGISLDDLLMLRPASLQMLFHWIKEEVLWMWDGKYEGDLGAVEPLPLVAFISKFNEVRQNAASVIAYSECMALSYHWLDLVPLPSASLGSGRTADGEASRGQLCDVALYLGQAGLISAHKCILLARSPVLREILSLGEPAEEIDCRALITNGKEFSRRAWSAWLVFCYTGTLPEELVPSTMRYAIELIELSCATQVYGLAIYLWDFMNDVHALEAEVQTSDQGALDLFLEWKDTYPWFWLRLRCALIDTTLIKVSQKVYEHLGITNDCSAENVYALLALS